MKKDINLICIYDDTKEDINKILINTYERIILEKLNSNDN